MDGELIYMLVGDGRKAFGVRGLGKHVEDGFGVGGCETFSLL